MVEKISIQFQISIYLGYTQRHIIWALVKSTIEKVKGVETEGKVRSRTMSRA